MVLSYIHAGGDFTSGYRISIGKGKAIEKLRGISGLLGKVISLLIASDMSTWAGIHSKVQVLWTSTTLLIRAIIFWGLLLTRDPGPQEVLRRPWTIDLDPPQLLNHHFLWRWNVMQTQGRSYRCISRIRDTGLTSFKGRSGHSEVWKGPDKLDLTRLSGYKFRSDSAKDGCRSSAPRARNELKLALNAEVNFKINTQAESVTYGFRRDRPRGSERDDSYAPSTQGAIIHNKRFSI
ncbi:hypothetical protein TNCV_3233531 [Trichonephila clavipes]|nr:hypothetical protein TNCV_3233531 [Trichonephila clavipes]